MPAPLLHIGNNITKESAQHFTESALALFKGAYECRLEQDTLKHALSCLVQVTEVKNITVTGSTFKGS